MSCFQRREKRRRRRSSPRSNSHQSNSQRNKSSRRRRKRKRKKTSQSRPSSKIPTLIYQRGIFNNVHSDSILPLMFCVYDSTVHSTWMLSSESTPMRIQPPRPFPTSGRTLTLRGGAFGRQNTTTTMNSHLFLCPPTSYQG